MKIVCLVVAFLVFSFTAMAQGYRLDGTINDADDHIPLEGATVKVTYQSDSTKWVAAEADSNGRFRVLHLPDGGYTLSIYLIGYRMATVKTRITGADKHLGSTLLQKNPTTLKDVPIIAKENRVVQKVDTTEYNANAYKVNPDASAEDLVTKMPGISSNNGTVTAHGETVQQVYVDGKEFFGQDATLALKNLPAEIIDKVQVFDKWTDQAQFTGFDDGNSQKAINITTKRGKSNGVFGKVYAGYGYIDDSKYSAGFGVNWFNGDRRISFIGLANNVNQQNFATQDLLGVIGTSTQRAGAGFGGGGGGRRSAGGGGGGGGNPSVNNFLIGNQPGISTTYSGGVNYQDIWGKKKKVKISGSYFVNYQKNNTYTTLSRNYAQTTDSTGALVYNETDNTNSININHRVSLRMEFTIDTNNKIIFTPRLNFQQNNQQLTQDGTTLINDLTASTAATQLNSHNFGYSFSGDLLYQHKFAKRHRTFSLDISSSVNNKFSTQLQNSNTIYADLIDSTVLLNQQTRGTTTSYTVSANAAYTEPVGKTGMLQFNYSPSNTWSLSDARTYNYDSGSESYDMLDTILSSKFNSTYMTQKAGVAYRFATKNINVSVGITGQYAILSGEENLPDELAISKTFLNPLPNAMFSIKSDSGSSLRIFYRTSTSPPSITQLQNVVNNNNPLFLSSGNPDLKQSYTHSLLLRYGRTNRKKAQSVFAYLGANYTEHYVGNSSVIPTKDTTLSNGLFIPKGTQFTLPVNLNGNVSLNSFLTFGFPIDAMKCNMNLNGGFNFTTIPALINGTVNMANTYTFNTGFVLGSNISEKIDFTISYLPSYNLVYNSVEKTSNNNYFSHTGNIKFNWLFWKGFVVNTSLQNTLYEGITQGFNLDVFLWNAGLGYKFLKDRSLEVRASVNDILNQNTGINRTIVGNYIEDSQTNVIKRYMLLTVTYTMRYFKRS
jgi:hypothetical protein